MTADKSPDLVAIRERAEAATPGPWKAEGRGWISGEPYADVISRGPVDCASYCYGGSSTIEGDNLEADAAHIAGMGPDVTLALVAELERLRASASSIAADQSPDLVTGYHARPNKAWRDTVTIERPATGERIDVSVVEARALSAELLVAADEAEAAS